MQGHYDDSPNGDPMYQAIVHFDPLLGGVSRDGKYRSPMTSLYHELIHACHNVLKARNVLTNTELREPVENFKNREESLAIQEENKLARHLGQGIRDRYGNSEHLYPVERFSAAEPKHEGVIRAIQYYNNNQISWDQLGDILAQYV